MIVILELLGVNIVVLLAFLVELQLELSLLVFIFSVCFFLLAITLLFESESVTYDSVFSQEEAQMLVVKCSITGCISFQNFYHLLK